MVDDIERGHLPQRDAVFRQFFLPGASDRLRGLVQQRPEDVDRVPRGLYLIVRLDDILF